jgi:putative sugar O-methyltransferase
VRLGEGTFDPTSPLPPGAAEELVAANPRLVELRRRYADVGGPLGHHTFWTDEYRRVDLELAHFRGDNAYVWQQRHFGDLRLKLYVYLQYLEALDERGLLSTLGEDGAFGCWSYEYAGHPRVSRDLLDSVNELYFLQRSWRLFERAGFSVLDIGAGYGRLAHRMVTGVPGLDHYYCVDAVPESTFLCEYYLRYRGVDGSAHVVALDELDRLPVGEIDLAVNIHSFSEMGVAAIDAWMAQLVRLRVPSLLVVPNEPEGLLSVEADGSRQPAEDRILRAGYTRVAHEPIFLEPSLPDLLGVGDQFFLYERTGG